MSCPAALFHSENLKTEKPDDVLPDPYPELPVERGPHGRGVGRWVVDEKHRYLARYLDATREAQKNSSSECSSIPSVAQAVSRWKARASRETAARSRPTASRCDPAHRSPSSGGRCRS